MPLGLIASLDDSSLIRSDLQRTVPTWHRALLSAWSERMPWVYLVFAGLFEIGFTTCMKLSNGFTRLGPSLAFLFFAVGSFVLLARATTVIPLGTGYAVWTGIGAFGTAVIGIVFFRDPATLGRIFFLALLIGSIIGLKLVDPAR